MRYILLFLILCSPAYAETWQATYYCPCQLCCSKNAKGITASGTKPIQGITVACNWLPFGTRLKINNHTYIVQDRGAKSIFGDKLHHKKCVDIFVNNHKSALMLGRKMVNVEIERI